MRGKKQAHRRNKENMVEKVKRTQETGYRWQTRARRLTSVAEKSNTLNFKE